MLLRLWGGTGFRALLGAGGGWGGCDEAESELRSPLVGVFAGCEFLLRVLGWGVENSFYGEFDVAVRDLGARRVEDYRSPFQVDRDRLIHSAPFRQLQSKTQVFVSGQYDFYRTRLTHTIEVAQVGRSICAYLRASSPFLERGFELDGDLVEAVCLAHDLGHPPFGHTGERTLNALMAEYGGFEGNAQTLRLLTETLYQGEKGMNPTRALADGVMKYKAGFGERQRALGRVPKNHFVYDDQLAVLDWVHDGLGVPGRRLQDGEWVGHKSLECQVMDWADDTAYCLNDLADGVKAGFVTAARVEAWAAERGVEGDEARWIEELLAMMAEDKVEGRLGRLIGRFIQAVYLVERQGELAGRSHRYGFDLVVEPRVRRQADLFKALAFEVIFRSPSLQQLDRKADRFLRALWGEFWELAQGRGGFDLLPRQVLGRLRAAEDDAARARLVADVLGRMSDGLAMRTYRRLFDPGFGSISDWA